MENRNFLSQLKQGLAGLTLAVLIGSLSYGTKSSNKSRLSRPFAGGNHYQNSGLGLTIVKEDY